MNYFYGLSVVAAVLAGLGGCSGGGGGSSVSASGNNSGIPQGKVSVDGHVFNPDFYDNGVSYVFISYFNNDGSLKSSHRLYTWTGSIPTYLSDSHYNYNSNGKISSVEGEFTYTREGLALYTHTFSDTAYTYDANGNLSNQLLSLTGADYNGDGIYTDAALGPIGSSVYTYDSNARLITETRDEGADGAANSSGDITTSYEYNAAGMMGVKREINGVGNDESTLYEYINGKKVKEIFYASAERKASDLKSSVTLFSYDASGNLIKEEIDNTTPGLGSINDTVDGITDITKNYSYGNNGELLEELTESLFLTYSEKTTKRHVYEVRDADANGTPDSIFTYITASKTTNSGPGYPADIWPIWYTNAQVNLNNGNSNDGWDLNWDGLSTGTCSTCGNMTGQVNRLLLGI